MIDPIRAAFVALVLHLHAPATCTPPHVIWTSFYIDNVCQADALPGYTAESCYDLKNRTVILPDGPLDQTLLYHEMARHVYQVCLGKVFRDAEPYSVVEAEDLAP